MFEKEAEEFADGIYHYKINVSDYGEDGKINYCYSDVKEAFHKGAEFVFNKANEWHKVSDKLPEKDVLVYLWNNVDDFPVVARRLIPYGHKEWVWDCKWGSGYIVSQSVGKDYLWKEIVLPELKESE